MTDSAQPRQSSDDMEEARAETMRRATEIAVRLGVLAIVVAFCLQIIAPFIGIVVWGLIIAIASTGAYEAVAKGLGDRRGLAATLFVLLGLAVIIIPGVLLSETLVSGAQHFAGADAHLKNRGTARNRRRNGHERHDLLFAASGQSGKEAADRLNAVLGVSGQSNDGFGDVGRRGGGPLILFARG